MKRGAVLFLSGLIVGVVSVFAFDFSSSSSSSSFTPVREGGSYTFINPLLECEAAEGISKQYTPFRHEIEEFVQKEIEESNGVKFASVYFRDLNNGPWFGINEREEFIPASLLKVPLMIAAYKQAESDPDFLSRRITFKQEPKRNVQYYPPKEKLELNKSYTVDDLVRRMIVYSDNNAMILAVANIKPEYIDQTFKQIGVAIPTENYTVNVKSYASFFRILFNSSYLNRVYSEKALKLLFESEFKDALAKGVPKGVVVAHKFGEKLSSSQVEKQFHDCGVVYYPGHPYLLCVMLRGENADGLVQTMSDISKAVYNEVGRQLK